MRGSIVKRGPSSFACVVYLGRDPATGKERQKWVSFKTRREAEAHLAHLVGQVSSGATLPPAKLRLGEYLERWLRDYGEGRLAPKTLESYRATVRVHLAPILGQHSSQTPCAADDPEIRDEQTSYRSQCNDRALPRRHPP